MRRQTKFTGISPAVWKECFDRDGGICRHCGKGGGKEIKEEMREYLQSLYPMWSEENQKYTKETGNAE